MSPTRGRTPRSRTHDPEPSQSELTSAKQVRWMHSVHSIGLSSSSSITRRPLYSTSCERVSFLPLFTRFAALSASFSSSAQLHFVLFFPPSFLSLISEHVATGLFPWRPMVSSEQPLLAIALFDAAHDRNLTDETWHRTISRIASHPLVTGFFMSDNACSWRIVNF